MPINFSAIAGALRSEMAHQGDTDKSLAKEWGISPMTLTNAKNGKPLSAELLCLISIYVGANPLSFWQYDISTTYSGGAKDATYGTMRPDGEEEA